MEVPGDSADEVADQINSSAKKPLEGSKLAGPLTSAIGRKRTLNLAILAWQKRPLSRKADIKPETPEIESEDVRFTPRKRTLA